MSCADEAEEEEEDESKTADTWLVERGRGAKREVMLVGLGVDGEEDFSGSGGGIEMWVASGAAGAGAGA